MSASGILLSGFEPFAGDPVNPSWEAVSALHGETLAGQRIETLRLPVRFADAYAPLALRLRRSRPALVIAVGLASSRPLLSVERVAINVDDARIADNAGAQPIDQPVVAGAPAAYFSRLPVKAILRAWRDAGLPGEVSQSAGTFVCNHVFYRLLHGLRRRPGVRAGFIHVPPARDHGKTGAGLPLDDIVAGLRLALLASLQQGPEDLRQAAGAID